MRQGGWPPSCLGFLGIVHMHELGAEFGLLLWTAFLPLFSPFFSIRLHAFDLPIPATLPCACSQHYSTLYTPPPL